MIDAKVTTSLRRELGLLDSTLLAAGVIVGSGIFMTTGVMAVELPSAPLLLLTWAVGGLLTLAGALTISELGAAMPEAGGQYVYLREAYGPLPAFLFGWLTLLVYQPGAIAAVAAGFAAYLGYFVPALGTENVLAAITVSGRSFSLSMGQLVAAAVIVGLTALNVRGVRVGSTVQNVFTFLKLGALAGFVVLGFTMGTGRSASSGPPSATPGAATLAGFGVALVAALWAYDGWINLTFSAGEIKDPARNLPRGLFLSTVIVTVAYLLVNAAYVRALPISEMQGVTRIAEKAATALFGPIGATLIAAAVAISTFGSTHGTILTGARVNYAMAKDHLFFSSAARVHPRFQTPHVSLWWQGCWSALLVLSGTFDQLFTFAMFAAILMYAGATAAVFTLRRKRPEMPRPYRTWGYPWMPLVYLGALLLLAGNTLSERPVESLAGLGLLALGVPVYQYWRRRPERPEDSRVAS
ncbi:MAG TPA: amino acid permease [Vicinamibacteria bacterium]|nr:amino acid permease [Vicinamibacteria bacterium]